MKFRNSALASIMRQRIIKFLSLATIFALGTVPAKATGQEWARKMFKEFQHDFGMVTKPSRPEHRFEIENIYEEDIRIRDIFSSCGCTSVSVTSRVLKTYEKAYVVCKFNSHIVDGPKQATVTVRFDAPFVGEVQLVIKGNAVRGSGVRLSTNQIDFGQVTNGQSSERVIQVSRQGSPNFKIDNVLSTFPHIGVSLRENYRGRDVVAYDVVARLKDSVPKGYSQGELFIVVDDNGQMVKFPVKFTAQVVAPVQISPEILTLSPIKPGEVVTRKVIVKADTPFKITDVTSHCRAFRVRADSTAKKVHFVDVIYTGEDDPGRYERVLTFQTSIGTGATTKMKAIVDIIPKSETTTKEASVTKTDVGT